MWKNIIKVDIILTQQFHEAEDNKQNRKKRKVYKRYI